ncbi:MAG: choice-of-anchor D domain-containing protein [Terriglobales bacterium]
MSCRAHRAVPRLQHAKYPRLLLVAATVIAIAMMLSACGGSGASGGSQPSGTLSGNWQFTVFQNPDPKYPANQLYGLQGGFLLQTNGSVAGQAVYSVSNLNSQNVAQVCNAGSAAITGTMTGSTVSFTAVAGTQTFTFTNGSVSSDGSTMSGTYTATQGTAPDGTVCGIGTSESGPQQWQANLVPPLTGAITGSFHSTGGASGLANQDFLVSGTFTQGENIGASNATIAGILRFSNYPCFSAASVNGQISGDSVILQVIGTNGAVIGQIGEPAGSPTGINPVTFISATGGYILQGTKPSYIVASSSCPGNLSSASGAGDAGAICLALNSTTTCQQPITLSPATVTFPAQLLVSPSTAQTVTLTNNSSSTLSSLTSTFADDNSYSFVGSSDFTGLPSFTETDACGPGGASSNGQPFDLASGQSCAITVTFSPQESCPWLPNQSPPSSTGAAPEFCPLTLRNFLVQVAVPGDTNPDHVTTFAAPISGVGLSAIQPSTPELDFGAENQSNPAEASQPQSLSFTNYSANPVQILSAAPCMNPYINGKPAPLKLPRPLTESSPVAGLQVLGSSPGVPFSISADGNTIEYSCDSDPGTLLPNFQISSDTCTGALLAPQASCSLQMTYVPQPNTDQNSGLDYFLELNTLECWPVGTAPSPSNPCEIDSGRFPVELKANEPSPLRMSPSAGLDFGTLGSSSSPTITLLNDPNLASPLTVTFVGTIGVTGNYSIPPGGDTCPATLAPGDSCTVSVNFTPTGTGFESGLLTIDYTQETSGGVVTNGNPQYVYLRGTGH